MFGAVLTSFLGDGRLQVVRADRDSRQGDEGQVTADQALLDSPEHRLVGFDVDVDVLEFADPSPLRSTSSLPCHSPMSW
jgi:hypothetical protein